MVMDGRDLKLKMQQQDNQKSPRGIHPDNFRLRLEEQPGGLQVLFQPETRISNSEVVLERW